MSTRRRIIAAGVVLLIAVELALLYPRLGLWAVAGAVLALLGVARYVRRRVERRPDPEVVAQVRTVLPDLSATEVAVLELMLAGAPSHEIAAEIGIPKRQVRMHIRSILERVGVHDRLASGV